MKQRWISKNFPAVAMTAREVAFRLYCRHDQGSRPNILVYCSRRGGSTWLLNTLSAHPGVRYVGKPFDAMLTSRWRSRVPPLGVENEDSKRSLFLGFDDPVHRQWFRSLADEVIRGKLHIHPTLNVRAEYFERTTDRIIFQMTNTTALSEWLHDQFPVETILLLRHPIPTALSIMELGWPPEGWEFLSHEYFARKYLTEEQLKFGLRIQKSGSLLERHVLDWTLKMLVPLRAVESGRYPDWTTLTYEEMVTQPTKVLEYVAARHDFPRPETMLRQLDRPSRSVTSSTETLIHDKSYLLNRWRKQVDETTVRRLMEILDAFEVGAYLPGSSMAASRYLIAENEMKGGSSTNRTLARTARINATQARAR